jgi:hypothetical protein
MHQSSADALINALLALFAVAAGPAVLASGLFAFVELFSPPAHSRDKRVSAAVDRGVALAFPYGAVFGLAALVYQLAKVPT